MAGGQSWGMVVPCWKGKQGVDQKAFVRPDEDGRFYYPGSRGLLGPGHCSVIV